MCDRIASFSELRLSRLDRRPAFSVKIRHSLSASSRSQSHDQKYYHGNWMDDWFHDLSVWWMALVVGAIVYLGAGVIFAVVATLGRGTRAQVFKNVSIGLLSPLGTIFGLLVVFILAQAWSDMDRAEVAVDPEASSLRRLLLLAAAFPGEPRRTFAVWSVARSMKPFKSNGQPSKSRRLL